jgi:RNA polymerase sigma-70 factor, ECF subfamily
MTQNLSIDRIHQPESSSKRRLSRRQRRRKERDLAFDAFYNEHYSLISQHANKLTSYNDELSDTIIQETFVKAWRAISRDRFDGSNPKAWLKRILRNTYFDHYHKMKRSKQIFSNTDLDDVSRTHASEVSDEIDLTSFNELLESIQSDIEDERWEGSLSDVIGDEMLHALRELSPKYRAAFLLQHIHQLSYEEISETLNCKVGTVMSRLSRARDQLHQALTERGGLIGRRLAGLRKTQPEFTGEEQLSAIIHEINDLPKK